MAKLISGLLGGIVALALTSGAGGQDDGGECRYGCQYPLNTPVATPSRYVQDQIKISRTTFKPDKYSLRHRVALSCGNETEIRQFFRSLIEQGGAGLVLNRKRSFVITATVKWDTQAASETPIVVPIGTFTRDVNNVVDDLECARQPIFPYINPGVDVYVSLGIRAVKDDNLSPTAIAGAQIFTSLVGIFAGVATGGTTALVAVAGGISKALVDNKAHYETFINNFDYVMDLKGSQRLATTDGALVFTFPGNGSIRFVRTPVLSPLVEISDGKPIQTQQDIPSQLKAFYLMDYEVFFKDVAENIFTQLRKPDLAADACKQIQDRIATRLGLLPDEKTIVLAYYLTRFDVSIDPPLIMCLREGQRKTLEKYSIALPYKPANPGPGNVAPPKVEEAAPPPSVAAAEAKVNSFFLQWHLAQSAANDGPVKAKFAFDQLRRVLAERVSITKEDGFQFASNDMANDEAAAKIFVAAPALNIYGCYRMSAELQKVNFDAQALVQLGSDDKPALANIVLGFVRTAKDKDVELKTFYIESVSERIKENVKSIFKTGCYGWKPFG